jgi:uncharacterized protein (TIGR02246 family)
MFYASLSESEGGNMTTEDRAAVEAVAAGLARAWNAGSGAGFAAYCDEDADFVNIYGMHARGRQAIADGHEIIFRTVYAGSTLQCSVEQARYLHPDIALVHLRSHLSIPRGPMAGTMQSVPSMVMQRKNGDWSIVAFQNTLVKDPRA